MKNYCPGKRIKTLESLAKQKIVWVAQWNKPSPMAFLGNWQFRLIRQFMEHGCFLYAVKVSGGKK